MVQRIFHQLQALPILLIDDQVEDQGKNCAAKLLPFVRQLIDVLDDSVVFISEVDIQESVKCDLACNQEGEHHKNVRIFVESLKNCLPNAVIEFVVLALVICDKVVILSFRG